MLKKQFENNLTPQIDDFLSPKCNYIGCIDDWIANKKLNDKGELIYFDLKNYNCNFNALPFVNEFPLILDSIKKYFYIVNAKYNVATINNTKYIVFKNYKEMRLDVYDGKVGDVKNYNSFVLDSCKRILAFNWLMCVKGGYNLTFETDIFIKSPNTLITKFEEFDSILYLYSINEKSYYYNNKKMDVPKNVLNKWFDGSLEVFYKEVKNLIRGIDADELRSKLIDIVNFYSEPSVSSEGTLFLLNNDYVSWVNVVYERFRYVRDLV